MMPLIYEREDDGSVTPVDVVRDYPRLLAEKDRALADLSRTQAMLDAVLLTFPDVHERAGMLRSQFVAVSLVRQWRAHRGGGQR